MSKKRQDKTSSASEFQKYLNNEMSGREAHAFERRLLNDPFEADALEGLSSIENSEIKTDIETLKTKLKKQPIVFWKRPSIYAAASVILLFGILSALWFLVPDEHTLVSNNQLKNQADKELLIEKDISIPKKINNLSEKKSRDIQKESPEQPAKEIIATTQAPRAKKENLNAFKLQESNDFKLADAQQFDIKAPESKPSVSRVEEEIMTVEYDSADKEIFKGYSGAASEKLTLAKEKVMNREKEPVTDATITMRSNQIMNVADIGDNHHMNIPINDTSKPLDTFNIGFVSQESSYTKADSVDFTLQEEHVILSKVETAQSPKKPEGHINKFIHAEPIGGLEKYITDIEHSLRYPANGSGKKEQVTVMLTISHLGGIKNIEFKRSPGEAFSVETIRAIRNGANWQPATRKGLPVDDSVKIKLRFIPSDK